MLLLRFGFDVRPPKIFGVEPGPVGVGKSPLDARQLPPLKIIPKRWVQIRQQHLGGSPIIVNIAIDHRDVSFLIEFIKNNETLR
jgi:hypothetical protein